MKCSRPMFCAAVLLAMIHPPLLAAEQVAGEPADFGRDIRPLLSQFCFSCHGPDAGTREADLRLDQRDDAVRDRDGMTVIAPGNPDASELVRRILSSDPDEMMPPPSSKKSLSSAQRQMLIAWISQGAVYSRHWSFIPPRQMPPPETGDPAWNRHPVDRFVARRIEQAGLQPSPLADAVTLVRRVSLDLTGLPPSPEEADAWAARLGSGDSFNEEVWEELVDSLLASPRYGERWARRWLDLARYADTNGYEKDRDRTVWPYRDWVINALNADMPFDQFTIEQVAGDLLPDATLEQQIATGFHRNTMLNEEGGIDPLEFRFHAMTDRVATTGTTWLGLTLGCAQCHTHKYDPLTHADYYGVMAFLNNADEPDLDIPDPQAEARARQRAEQAGNLLTKLPELWPVPEKTEATADQTDEQRRSAALQMAFESWLADQRKQTVSWTVMRPTTMKTNLPLLTVQPDDSVFASGDFTKLDTYDLDFGPLPAGITALRLEALPDDRLPAHGPGTTYYEGRKGDFFLGEFQVHVNDQPVPVASATHSYARNQFGNNEVSARLATDGDVQTGWSTAQRQGERHVAVFEFQQPQPAADELHLRMIFGRHFASSLGRFRLSYTTQQRAVAREMSPEIERLLLSADEQLEPVQRQQLLETFLLQAPEVAEHAKQIHALRQQPDPVSTLVLRERPADNPRPTHRHHRGEYLQPREEVVPATPEALPGLPADSPRNRLGFARWLVLRDNPLTARVVVNRHWAALFGAGIVKTVDDFGMQGTAPSHPELLDWLAVDFMDQGWSLKTLHRRLVTSRTYRQSAIVSDAARQADPANQWLARGARFRLEAEIIRDATLQSAGVLSLKMGGPPVRPSQPDGVTEAAWGSPKWNPSGGEDRFRRSVYTYQKRTAPFAMFNTFDAPSGESCTARRDVSNTALQALTLLNDVMFVEAARHAGQQTARREGTQADRIRAMFRQALTREPSADELTALNRFVDTQRERLLAGELSAAELQGQTAAQRKPSDAAAPADSVDPLIEAAVWTTLARVLFSTDEAQTRN